MSDFKKYFLSEEKLVKIARLCVQEQGSIAGIKAEASLMCNQLETDAARQKKYGTDGDGLYNWVRNGKWFYKAAYFMDNGNATQKQINAVRSVIVKGERTLPQYIDEHDCISDISSISTGDKRNRGDYIKGRTIIKNDFGSRYTFWCFPDAFCDPFGYTDRAYSYVRKHGGSVSHAAEGASAYCNGQDVNFRKEPRFGDNVLFMLNRGEVLRTLSTEGMWTKCTARGCVGYVWADYLTIISDRNTSYDDIALKVIDGNYGNGDDRIKRLKRAGYTDKEIKEIQKRVNEILKGA